MQNKTYGTLPSSASEFSDPVYWKKFFSKHEAPFEWYGSFNELGEVLTKYIKTSDRILQIGCGNSQLASQLYDSGYRDIVSIDTDEAVIAKQVQINKERRSLKFVCESASNVHVESNSVNVVVDKGTLDALIPPNCNEQQQIEVGKIFGEVERILVPNGRYVVVSLAQIQVLQHFIQHFSESHRYMVRVQKVCKTGGFFMPVFLMIATKVRVALPNTVLEFMRTTNGKADRCSKVEELYTMVKAEQEYAWFVHRCQRRLSSEISLVMCDKNGVERYKVIIVDDFKAEKITKYSVFIVPSGRDNEWLFATEKGRTLLRNRCNVTRLAIVLLFRSQTYGDFTSIKSELDGFVAEFDPRRRNKNKDTTIAYFTLESDSPLRVVAKGESTVNGPWAVEEVVINEKMYRRLTFFSSQNLLQTEVLLSGKKKGRKTVNLDVLTSEYHEIMVAALAFAPGFSTVADLQQWKLRIAVLGLGGGALPSYLCRNLNKCHILSLEYDEAVVEIAEKYFGLIRGSSGVDVRVENAIDFVKKVAYSSDNGGEVLDVLMVDVAGSLDDQGMYCPPASFVTMDMIKAYHDALSDLGILVLNIVTRDEEMSLSLKMSLDSSFASVFTSTSVETINEVLICCKGNVDLMTVHDAIKSLKSTSKMVDVIAENFAHLKLFALNRR